MPKVYEVPLKVMRVVNAKYLTPNHETISVITDQGAHQIYVRDQNRDEFDLIVKHVKDIEPFMKKEPELEVAPVPVMEPTPPAPEPVMVSSEPVPVAPPPPAEPDPVPVEPAPEPPAPVEPVVEPAPVMEPETPPPPQPEPDPLPGTPEAALKQAEEMLQQPPVPTPEAPKTE
jgi:hypothetical protein